MEDSPEGQEEKRGHEAIHRERFHRDLYSDIPVSLGCLEDARPRLNVLLNSLSPAVGFGGLRSALQLPRRSRASTLTCVHCDHEWCWQCRCGPDGVRSGLRPEADLGACAAGRCPPRLHQREIFFCTWWQTVCVWKAYRDALLKNGMRVNDFYYLIQDFEPAFYSHGAEYAACLASYEDGITSPLYSTRSSGAFFREETALRFKHATSSRRHWMRTCSSSSRSGTSSCPRSPEGRSE